jgi:molecular chaperone DnaJ
VRQYHPDLNPNNPNAEERFKEVAVAYEVLGDEKKRKLYNEFGMAGVKAGFDPDRAREYQKWTQNNPFGESFSFGNFDFGSLFDQFYGGMGQQQPKPTGPTKGQDLERGITVNFLEAVLGAKREYTITKPTQCDSCRGSGSRTGRPSVCPRCGGSGRMQTQQGLPFFTASICPQCGGTGEAITDPCSQCRSTGVRDQEVKLNINLPPGIEDNSRIRLAGQGAAGQRGGPSGDLYLIPKIREHAAFTRDGNNIVIELPITPYEAYTGTTLDIPTPHGSVSMRIPPGSQSGQKLRLRGKGVASYKNRPAGDLLISLKIVLPPPNDEESKQLLNKLQNKYTEDVRKELKINT